MACVLKRLMTYQEGGKKCTRRAKKTGSLAGAFSYDLPMELQYPQEKIT